MRRDEDIIKQKIERFAALKSHRSTFNSHWDEVARVATPRDNLFFTTRSPGQKNRSEQFDSTAELSLNRASSFYDSVTTPRNKRWHGLVSPHTEIDKNINVRRYFDNVENILFKNRYGPRSGFPGQRYEQIRSLWSFGNGIIFTDMEGTNIRYRAIHLSQFYMDENHSGIIDVGYREMPMTIRQMIQQFGESNVPESIRRLEKNEHTKKYSVIHSVEPNPDHDPESLNPEDRKFVSYYILTEGEEAILESTGYKTFPYSISRDTKSPREIYGRSALMSVLPTIKTLNQMKKTDLKASHMVVDAPVLMSDDGAIDIGDLRPGRAVVGGLDSMGRPKVVPYQSGNRVDIAEGKITNEQNTIREAFLLDMFAVNFEREMTATEFMGRQQEQARLLTPLTGREETEALSPLIERELQLYNDAGMLPEMPQELVETFGEFEPQYTSPIANAQKADEAIGARQTVLAGIELAQAGNQDALKRIKGSEYIAIVADANSTPARMMHSDEEFAELLAQEQQAQEQQMLIENAQQLSQAGLNVANTQQVVDGE